MATTTTRETKADLLRRIAELEARLKAVTNELEPFSTHWANYIPCGPMLEVWGHPFEQEIRDQTCDQWCGDIDHEVEYEDLGIRSGWMIVQMPDNPLHSICVHITYNDRDGLLCDGRFCQVTKVSK
jgi:hypothetical protein